MKDYKCKSMLVNDKVDNSVVSVNPCVPVQLDLFNDVIESQVIASYNFINVRLSHRDFSQLDSFCFEFVDYCTKHFALCVLQRVRVHSRSYTIITNKDLHQIHSVLFDFDHDHCSSDGFSMEY